MYISNVTEYDLNEALKLTNEKYKGNIIFHTFEKTSNKGDRFRVRLQTKDYDRPGYRRTHMGKRHPSACWHSHGHFFDNLLDVNEKAVIRTGGDKIYKKNGHVVGNWNDRNIGSLMQPLYFSEACDC